MKEKYFNFYTVNVEIMFYFRYMNTCKIVMIKKKKLYFPQPRFCIKSLWNWKAFQNGEEQPHTKSYWRWDSSMYTVPQF